MTTGPQPPAVAREVLVVTGTGGIGLAVARRLGPGRSVVLADVSAEALATAAAALRAEGYDVHEVPTDVADRGAVDALAGAAAALGPVAVVVHTAGVSPVQADPARVVAVDVLGTAHLLDAFAGRVAPGGAVVCVASMAGAMVPLPAEVEQALAATPTAALAALPLLDPAALDPGAAYSIAKRANQLRVQAASAAYGRRGARVVSVSPGIVATPMGRAELDGPSGDAIRAMVAASGAGRVATPDDVAAAVEFLAGPAASFVTGTDLLVDGGAVAALRFGTRS